MLSFLILTCIECLGLIFVNVYGVVVIDLILTSFWNVMDLDSCIFLKDDSFLVCFNFLSSSLLLLNSDEICDHNVCLLKLEHCQRNVQKLCFVN